MINHGQTTTNVCKRLKKVVLKDFMYSLRPRYIFTNPSEEIK